MQRMKLKNIRVAHSPDADDIFMYSAINLGWVGSEILQFSSKADDIETLNQAALRGEFDATAISFALYPFNSGISISNPPPRMNSRSKLSTLTLTLGGIIFVPSIFSKYSFAFALFTVFFKSS